jgi:hypothetical protein
MTKKSKPKAPKRPAPAGARRSKKPGGELSIEDTDRVAGGGGTEMGQPVKDW